MKSWTESQIINSLKENMFLQITYFASFVPLMQILENGAKIKITDIKDDTFNMVFDSHFESENVDRKIDEIISLYQKKDIPFSWWVGPGDKPDNLKEILISKGLSFKENDYGMYLDLQKHQPKPLKKLEIKSVLNKEELKKFNQVHLEAFGSSKAFDLIFSKIPENAYSEKAPYKFYIGYHNNKAVSTGALVYCADVVGIYYIVTLPEERKKGYATDMMNYLLDQAKKLNYQMAILFASEMGKKVYEKIGFKECCVFQELALEYAKLE